jgi:hypothetical protein
MRGRCCLPSWQQYWQQLRPNGTDPRPPTFQAGHNPQLARIVWELCAVAGHCWWSVAAAVAVTCGQGIGWPGAPRLCAWCENAIPARALRDTVCCSVRCRQARHRLIARILQGMAPYPGQVRCLVLGFWPECFRRLDVKGGRRTFPEETRSALDIEGKHVTIQGPSPGLSPARTLHHPSGTHKSVVADRPGPPNVGRALDRHFRVEDVCPVLSNGLGAVVGVAATSPDLIGPVCL